MISLLIHDSRASRVLSLRRTSKSPTVFQLFSGICLAIVVYYITNNTLIQGLARVFYIKFTENILPYHSIQWLANYDAKDAILNNLHYNDDHSERPNILLIIADDLGVNDIAGGCGIATPNIDSIARNGLNFTQAYSSQATCAPSRAALLTGRLPTKIGYEFTPVPKFLASFMGRKRIGHDTAQPVYHSDLYNSVPEMLDIELPKNVSTMPELLGELGYHNYLIGKWDGGSKVSSSPIARGFDESLSFMVGGSLYAKPTDPTVISATNITFDNVLKKLVSYKVSFNNQDFFEPNEYMTEYLGTEASNLIHDLAEKKRSVKSHPQQHGRSNPKRDDPWFITLAFTAPHNPFQALKTDYEREDIQKIPTFIGRVYASMILALDRNVGKVIDSLKATGQYNNTIIIFTSDNGAAPYVGLPHLNAPYRGWKGTLFEGGIRIPFLVQWPQFITDTGRQIDDVLIHLDILPSLLAVASKGINIVNGYASQYLRGDYQGVKGLLENVLSDGRDFLSKLSPSYFRGFPSKPTLPSNEESSFAVTAGTVRTVSSLQDVAAGRVLFWRSGHYQAIRYGNFKLQTSQNPKKLWFYDLSEDPSEQNNLIPALLEAESLNRSLELSFHSPRSRSPMLMTGLYDRLDRLLENVTTFGRTDDSAEYDLIDEYDPIVGKVGNSADLIFSNLLRVYGKLKEIDSQQVKPMWPALVEVPICIDKPEMHGEPCTINEEYIIFPN